MSLIRINSTRITGTHASAYLIKLSTTFESSELSEPTGRG